jgi:hypothetical protein
MAEVIGPIGVCFAGLSFILSTGPAAAKARHNLKEREVHVGSVRVRLANCIATFSLWSAHWRDSNLEGYIGSLHSNVQDVKDLCATIEGEIQGHTSNVTELKAWHTTKKRARKGIFLRHETRTRVDGFCSAIKYALWKKDILENWISRLEKDIEAIHKLYERDFHSRNAPRSHGAVDLAQVDESARLTDFAQKLTCLAMGLYQECTNLPGTTAWAVGLRTPEAGQDISRWDVPTPIKIELQFSARQEINESDPFRIHVIYQVDNRATHTPENAIKQVNGLLSSSSRVDSRATSSIGGCDQQRSTTKSSSIGHLLEHWPRYFRGDSWLVDRAELVYAISEWILLLWDTPWLSRLCCHGLEIVVGNQSKSRYAKHVVFIEADCDCPTPNGRSRLRNLGIVWAQLVLGTPIRPALSGDPREYQVWSEKIWETVFHSDINARVHMETGSQPLQEAISFCLTPGSLPMGERLETGYLYKCIEKIHKPLVNNCRTLIHR